MNVKQIKKNIKSKPDPLYNTTVGSLITTVAMVTGKSAIQSRKYFNMLNKNKKVLEDKTFKEMAEYVFTTFGDESVEAVWKDSLVLVYDDYRSPLFALFDGERVLPISPDGHYTGILTLLTKSEDEITTNFGVERIFFGEGEYNE